MTKPNPQPETCITMEELDARVAFCRAVTGISETAFSEAVNGDGSLLQTIRRGRSPRHVMRLAIVQTADRLIEEARLAALAIVAKTDAQDDSEAAFTRWKASHAENRAAPIEADTDHLWEAISNAEVAVMNSRDRTRRSAAIRLWIALAHFTGDRDVETAATSEDLPALVDMDADLDWGAQLIVKAIDVLSDGEGR